MSVQTKPAKRLKRRRRVRSKVRGTAERPRLSVFRSNKGFFVQLVDDVAGRTLVAVNWTEPEFKSLGSMEQAKAVGGRSRSAPRRPELRAASSTAAVTSTTDASPPSLRARAKEGSRSDGA